MADEKNPTPEKSSSLEEWLESQERKVEAEDALLAQKYGLEGVGADSDEDDLLLEGLGEEPSYTFPEQRVEAPLRTVDRGDFEGSLLEYQRLREDSLRRDAGIIDPAEPTPDDIYEQALDDAWRWRYVGSDLPGEGVLDKRSYPLFPEGVQPSLEESRMQSSREMDAKYMAEETFFSALKGDTVPKTKEELGDAAPADWMDELLPSAQGSLAPLISMFDEDGEGFDWTMLNPGTAVAAYMDSIPQKVEAVEDLLEDEDLAELLKSAVEIDEDIASSATSIPSERLPWSTVPDPPVPKLVSDPIKRVVIETGLGRLYVLAAERLDLITPEDSQKARAFFSDATDNQAKDNLVALAGQGDDAGVYAALGRMNVSQFEDLDRWGLGSPSVSHAKELAKQANGDSGFYGPAMAPALELIFEGAPDKDIEEALSYTPIGGMPPSLRNAVLPDDIGSIAAMGEKRKKAKELTGAETTTALENVFAGTMFKKTTLPDGGVAYVESDLGMIFRAVGGTFDAALVEPDIKVMDIMSPFGVLDPIYEATIYGEEGMDIAEEVRIPTPRGLDFMFASDHLGPILRDIFGVREYEPVRDPETTWWARVLSNMHTGEQGLFTHVPRFARQLEEVSTVPFAESELFPEAAEAAQYAQTGASDTLRDVLGVELPKRTRIDLDSRLDNIITAISLGGDFLAPDPLLVGGWQAGASVFRRTASASAGAALAKGSKTSSTKAAAIGAFPEFYAARHKLPDRDALTSINHFFHNMALEAASKGENPYDVMTSVMRGQVDDVFRAAGIDPKEVRVRTEESRKGLYMDMVDAISEYGSEGLKATAEMRAHPNYKNALQVLEGQVGEKDARKYMALFETWVRRDSLANGIEPVEWLDNFELRSAKTDEMPNRVRFFSELDEVYERLGVPPRVRTELKLSLQAATQKQARAAKAPLDEVYAGWSARTTDEPPEAVADPALFMGRDPRYRSAFRAKDHEVRPVPIDDATKFINKHHYAGIQKIPVQGTKIVGLYAKGGDRLLGVALWRAPSGAGVEPSVAKSFSGPELKRGQTLELSRMAIVDDAPPNAASFLIARSVQRVRADNPDIRVLVSYADTGQSHRGGVYQASGWLYDGIRPSTDPFWVDDQGRRVSRGKRRRAEMDAQYERFPPSDKHRWVKPLDKKLKFVGEGGAPEIIEDVPRDSVGRVTAPLRLRFSMGSGPNGGWNVVSLFDGISTGRQAMKNIGLPVASYKAAEVDKYAVKVASSNHPDIQHLGDVKGVKGTELGETDLFIGGSPCQDLRPGRGGLRGPKSKLFWEYVRVKNEVNPKYFLFENTGKITPEDAAVVTRELGVEPIKIDSAGVSGQRRVRYYWTNIPDVKTPNDLGIRQSEAFFGLSEAADLGPEQIGRISDVTRAYMDQVPKGAKKEPKGRRQGSCLPT
jgi:hypothetical protein